MNLLVVENSDVNENIKNVSFCPVKFLFHSK